MSDARKCRPFHRWQPVGNSDRFAPRATGRDDQAVRDRSTLRPLRLIYNPDDVKEEV